MGKYVLGWFLGVPLIVLVAIYFFAHDAPRSMRWTLFTARRGSIPSSASMSTGLTR